MKFFFLKEHGLYKIFKTLEKIPHKKTVHIYIDPEHAFFENERRGKQIKDILYKREVTAFFVAKSERIRSFYERVGLPYIFQERHPVLKFLHVVYLFLFNIKKFHLHAIQRKNYIFYVVFGIEFAFILFIIYGLYALIIPSATIQVTPAYQVEDITYNFRYYPASDVDYPDLSRYLSIPFSLGYLDHKYELTISANNIRHIQNPSAGILTVFNPTDEELSLVQNTRFITAEGLLFKATSPFTIPAGYSGHNGQVNVPVIAMDTDEENNIIGVRGNIGSGTQLWIRNLTKSFFTKEIYAEADQDFNGGSSVETGFLTAQDVDILSGKLVEYIEKNTQNIVTKNFNNEESIFVNFQDLVHYEIQDIVVDDYLKQEQPILKGTITARIYFPYVARKDFSDTIMLYTEQRPSDKVNIINIDRNSLIFYDDVKKVDDLFIIPTKISIVQGYDFDADVNKVVESMKGRMVGVSIDQARDIALGYPEVSTARIIVRPPRYTTLPKLKSRIGIRINKPE